ncbi:MAG: hypothetical protein ACRDSZ_19910 [Pseudonocardiaceae bacterium]
MITNTVGPIVEELLWVSSPIIAVVVVVMVGMFLAATITAP